MHPPFSAIFLTVLIGAGQGLFLMLFGTELFIGYPLGDGVHHYLGFGAAVALCFTAAGLVASFFHLGQPQRAWRGMTQWRTSWLAREGIALPLFMLGLFAYALLHLLAGQGVLPVSPVTTLLLGLLTAVVCMALFLCTGMIYVSIRFLQEWATPLTLLNFLLLGSASGAMLASVWASLSGAAPLLFFYGPIATALALLALLTRGASLLRNAQLKSKSSLQTAIGVKHPRIVQKAQGFMGGSYNTREFFHGKSAAVLRSVKWIFLLFVFVLPFVLIFANYAIGDGYVQRLPLVLSLAFVVQFIGLIAERWFFFAQARHPQNLYYQTIS